MMSHEYEDVPQKYFILDEWNLTNRFSYDENLGFCDLKIFEMQNKHGNKYQMEEFGLPWRSSAFCTAFSEKKTANTKTSLSQPMFLGSRTMLRGGKSLRESC